jgi:hypothetical protein
MNLWQMACRGGSPSRFEPADLRAPTGDLGAPWGEPNSPSAELNSPRSDFNSPVGEPDSPRGEKPQNVIFAASCTIRLSKAPISSPKLVCGISRLDAVL